MSRPGGHRGARAVRRRVLRLQPPGSRDHGPAAAGVPRDRLDRSGDGRLRRGAGTAARSASTRARASTPTAFNLHLQPGGDGRRSAGLPAAHRQRQGLPHHPGLLQAEPAGAERDRADGLLDVARGRAPGVPEPAQPRVRHRARGRRLASAFRRRPATSIRKAGSLSRRALPGLRPAAQGTVGGSGSGSSC